MISLQQRGANSAALELGDLPFFTVRELPAAVSLATRFHIAAVELDILPQDEQRLLDLAAALETRHHPTYEHSIRVALLAKEIGQFLGLDGRPLFYAGFLHDIGKIAVPPELLDKRGEWRPIDRERMKPHVIEGYYLVRPHFPFTAEVILLHHRFQRDPYPEHLPPFLDNYSRETRERIGSCARILALADCYDAIYRMSDHFEPCYAPDGADVRARMFERNPDQHPLITELYARGIF
jgi:putative nucleotidyltransferase with HDIG domain